MDKERILALLREHEAELKASGLLHLRLFGSVARGDNTAESDVDLLADYADQVTLFGLGRLQDRLSSIVGHEVHLASYKNLKPVIRKYVMKDLIDAF